MYTITVNNKHTFNLSEDKGTLSYKGDKVDYDLQWINQNKCHIIYLHKSYIVEVVAFNKVDKTVAVKVNNKDYILSISDQYDELLKKMGFNFSLSDQIKEIKAPMPGLVLNILVHEGQEIAKGDNLIVLEAMKMENLIKSPLDAVIKSIKVKKGDKLEKNQLIITF